MTDDYIERLRRRFEAKVDRTPGHGPAGECALWRGAISDTGYGQIKVRGKTVPAHHAAIYLATGEWPPVGALVLHAPVICHTKTCVNDAHLRPGTYADNVADRVLDGTARKSHCVHGHAMDAANTYVKSNGAWRCRVCNAAVQRAFQARKAAAVQS